MSNGEILDDEEEVVHPNSPLCNYMRELSISDDNLYQDTTEDCIPVANKFPSVSTMASTGTESSDSTLANKMLKFINFIYSLFLSHVFILEHSLIRNSLESQINKHIFIEEDRDFIKNWVFVSKSNLKRVVISRALILFALSSFAIFVIYFSFLTLDSNTDIINIFFEWQKIIHLYPSFGAILLLAFNMLEIYECFMTNSYVNNHLKDMETLYSNIKKCIRLIQEGELVARGFTAASVCSLADRLELSSSLPIVSTQRQYIELRKFIYSSVKEVFMEYRKATNNLIDRISHDIELDFASNYLAQLDLKEFGSIVQYDINSESEYEELLKITDNLSITSLRTMFDLMELQVSEFYKCLFLSSFIYSQGESKNNGLLQTVESSDRRMDMASLYKKVKCLLDQVNCKYNYYRLIEVGNVNDKETKKCFPNKSGMKVMIHNMTLHLKAALLKLVEIEDKLSNKDLISENSEEKALAKDVASLLHIVKSEVEAHQEYSIHCFNFLSKIIDSNKEEIVKDPISVLLDKENESNVGTSTIERCDAENEVQDEVYEDIISKNIADEVEEKVFNQEDCLKNKKLLKELKSVLVIKAEEHQAREQIALARKLKDQEFFKPENLPVTDIKATHLQNSLKEDSFVTDDFLSDPVLKEHNIQEEKSEDRNANLNFLLEQKRHNSGFITGAQTDSFAAAIASMAAIQRQNLNLTSEEFTCDSNEDEILEN